MKISNEKILTDMAGLRALANRQMPIKASYAIAKNLKKIDSELEIYSKEREKLIDKYAEKDDKGKVKADKEGQIIFKDKDAWAKDIEELLSIEVDIKIHKFPISALEGYDMSPAELTLIDYMIED